MIENLKGRRFGMLTAVERVPPPSEHYATNATWWRCICDCGNEAVVRSYALKNGNTRSCGCLRKKSRRAIDLTGERFGKLEVIRRAKRPDGELSYLGTYWQVKCDCGSSFVIRGDYLKHHGIRSCGKCEVG